MDQVDQVELAKLAEQAERYEDMAKVNCVKHFLNFVKVFICFVKRSPVYVSMYLNWH